MRVCNELGRLINRGKTTCGCITRAKMSRLLFRGPIVARHLEVEGGEAGNCPSLGNNLHGKRDKTIYLTRRASEGCEPWRKEGIENGSRLDGNPIKREGRTRGSPAVLLCAGLGWPGQLRSALWLLLIKRSSRMARAG